MTPERLNALLQNRLPHWPRLLSRTHDFPSDWRIHEVQPFEPLTRLEHSSLDAVVLNRVCCITPDWLELLCRIHALLKPAGCLMIADVFRRRNLPSDLADQPTLWACGLAQTPRVSELINGLTTNGFTITQQHETPDELDRLFTAFDAHVPSSTPLESPLTEADWIAATQACCGLGTPKTDRLWELLKCDDIHALWCVNDFLAQKT
jgi:SAM-dependent methyltransferase